MTFLSYKFDPVAKHAVAAESDKVDLASTFMPNGNVYTLQGVNLGFNVMVFGSIAPNGLINFQRIPMFVEGWDKSTPGDFGRIINLPEGTVAIEWPLH
jgi:hypothetical protein